MGLVRKMFERPPEVAERNYHPAYRDDHELRQWYAARAAGHGWSVAVLP
jgi:hypothetical protein